MRPEKKNPKKKEPTTSDRCTSGIAVGKKEKGGLNTKKKRDSTFTASGAKGSLG